MKKLLVALAIVVALPTISSASVLLTDATGYTGRGLNLAAYENGMYNFTFGPIPVDGFTFTAAPGGGGNSGRGSVVGQGSYGLGSNGRFGGDAVYIGVDSGTGYAQLLGTVGYDQMGFYFNYAPGIGSDATISTLDAGGSVIDSFNLVDLAPISTPNGFNQFAFRGVAYDDGTKIYGMRFGGNYILLTGTEDGSVGGEIPEPATLAMWSILGLCFGGALVRRKRAANRSAA